MLNQPQFVYSYTIPYYIDADGESIELFVSEKTYDLYFSAQQNIPLKIISGSLHPEGEEQGEITTTLFDSKQAIIIIGTKDITDLSNELMDIVIATELERILDYHPSSFYYFLYQKETPFHIRTFIDDLQHTLEIIPITKRLLKKGFRVIEREKELIADIEKHAAKLASFKKKDPLTEENGLFLINKLLFLYFVDKPLFKHVKQEIHPHWPKIFFYIDLIIKEVQRQTITSTKGRSRAIVKVLQKIGYLSYAKQISIDDIVQWKLPTSIS